MVQPGSRQGGKLTHRSKISIFFEEKGGKMIGGGGEQGEGGMEYLR